MDRLDHLGWVVHQSFEVGGVEFGLRTNSEVCASWLEAVFGDYMIDDETDPYYSILIGESNGKPGKPFHILYEESRAVVRTHDPHLLGKAVMAQFEFAGSSDRRDAAFLEAAAVELDGVIGLVPALIVPFIDTLGRRAVERSGLRLSATNYTAVDLSTGKLIPPVQTLNLPPDPAGMLAELVPSHGSEGRFTIDEPTAVNVVCSIGVADQDVLTMSPAGSTHTLARKVRNLPEIGGAGLQAVARLVEGAKSYELASVKPKNLLDALVDVLRHGA